MISESVRPLRKKGVNGKVYTRFPKIESKLLELKGISREALSARCETQDVDDPDYVPSECLVHLVREERGRSADTCTEVLYRTLLARVMRALPNGESNDGKRLSVIESGIRERAFHAFVEMLMKDRGNYVEALDIYEVRFAKPLRKLRLDARKWVKRREDPLVSIEIDDETGDISKDIGRSTMSVEAPDTEKIDISFYLSRLPEAIEALPPLERAIIEMDRQEIPTESKEPGVLTISGTLGKTPKTIRTHRGMAHAALRDALLKGEPR